MPYLVDGHNLIPKIDGLDLSDLDDENALVQVLLNYCRIKGKAQIEVYFDKASPGSPPVKRHGMVTAHYVSSASSADAAIMRKLIQLGRKARNWTVVSSDRQVQTAARSSGARVISSESFAHLLKEAGRSGKKGPEPVQPEVSEKEVESWLEEFRSRGSKNQS